MTKHTVQPDRMCKTAISVYRNIMTCVALNRLTYFQTLELFTNYARRCNIHPVFVAEALLKYNTTSQFPDCNTYYNKITDWNWLPKIAQYGANRLLEEYTNDYPYDSKNKEHEPYYMIHPFDGDIKLYVFNTDDKEWDQLADFNGRVWHDPGSY